MFKILKNGSEKARVTSKKEALKKLALIVDDHAMSTNYYFSDENHTITHPDSQRVIFREGDESASIGDCEFEIVEDNVTIKKLLDLSHECVKYWAKKAIDEDTSFKPFVQAHLEREAISNSFVKTEVREKKKNK